MKNRDFKIGKKYRCIKSFFMYNGELSFLKDNYYPVINCDSIEVCFKDENDENHYMRNDDLLIFDIKCRKEKLKRILE